MTEGAKEIRGVRTRVVVPPEPTRRTLDENLVARFPGLLRALGAIWSRLPPKSRLRRAWIRRIGRRACAAGNRRDFELLVAFVDPEVEYELQAGGEGLAALPDLQSPRRGRDAYVGIWEAVADAWPDVRLEFEEVIDFGDRLLTVGRLRGHGGATGIPLDEQLFQLFDLRRGVTIRQRDFSERDEAFAAATELRKREAI
jgi:hypothetical protein